MTPTPPQDELYELIKKFIDKAEGIAWTIEGVDGYTLYVTAKLRTQLKDLEAAIEKLYIPKARVVEALKDEEPVRNAPEVEKLLDSRKRRIDYRNELRTRIKASLGLGEEGHA